MADQTQLYHSGSLTDGWRLFGAHPATEEDVHGWWFNVWAPHAKAVSVVGDFNGWDLTVDPLTQKGEFWQGFLPDLPVYTSYKFTTRRTPTGSIRRPAPAPPASSMTLSIFPGRMRTSAAISSRCTISR